MTLTLVGSAVDMTGCEYFDPGALKFFPNHAREHECVRGIAMQTQTLDRHGNQRSVNRHDVPMYQLMKLRSHAVFIVDDGSCFGSRN
jgi:hypothetical protein